MKIPGLFWGQFRRDGALALRQPGELANPLAFFVLVITLFPLGVSPESAVLAPLAAGVLWIAALWRRCWVWKGFFAGIGMRVR